MESLLVTTATRTCVRSTRNAGAQDSRYSLASSHKTRRGMSTQARRHSVPNTVALRHSSQKTFGRSFAGLPPKL